MNRCLSRVIAASIAVASATAFVGVPALAQDVIKVGAPLPLTGALSPEGLKQKESALAPTIRHHRWRGNIASVCDPCGTAS